MIARIFRRPASAGSARICHSATSGSIRSTTTRSASPARIALSVSCEDRKNAAWKGSEAVTRIGGADGLEPATSRVTTLPLRPIAHGSFQCDQLIEDTSVERSVVRSDECRYQSLLAFDWTRLYTDNCCWHTVSCIASSTPASPVSSWRTTCEFFTCVKFAAGANRWYPRVNPLLTFVGSGVKPARPI